MTEAFRGWKKSSRSGGNNQCVEWASAGGRWAIRDSKSPAGSMLIFPAAAAVALVACVRRGDYDV